MTAIGRLAPNVATAKALAEKLRLTEEPLTALERLAVAGLLHAVADRIDFRPADSFDVGVAWATVAAAFDVRMAILRSDQDDGTGGVL